MLAATEPEGRGNAHAESDSTPITHETRDARTGPSPTHGKQYGQDATTISFVFLS